MKESNLLYGEYCMSYDKHIIVNGKMLVDYLRDSLELLIRRG